MGDATGWDQNGGELKHLLSCLVHVSTSLKCFVVFQVRAGESLDLKDSSQPKVDISDDVD